MAWREGDMIGYYAARGSGLLTIFVFWVQWEFSFWYIKDCCYCLSWDYSIAASA